ncbi:MAG: DUF4956 domain-containing protein [Bacillota bacterium]
MDKLVTNFTDIFKNSFLNIAKGDLSYPTILLSLLSAFICGMVIFFVYKRFYKGIIYSNNFNILLVLVSVITAFIVLTISSNVVLSLGMVGALSIVRFRTAVKDPLDVGFVFWAVGIGITCGAGLYIMSFLSTVTISLIYILLSRMKSSTRAFLLIVKFNNSANEQVQSILKMMNFSLKNKTGINGKTELTLEIKSKSDNSTFVTILSNLEGVHSATLVEYTGDFGE